MTRDDKESAAGTIDVVERLDLEVEGQQLITPIDGLMMAITAYWHHTIPPAVLSAFALRYHPQFLVQYVGMAFVTVVPHSCFQDQGADITYFDSVSHGELAKYQVFLMRAGDFVWVPAGWAPIWVGTNPTVDWASKGSLKLPSVRTKHGATQKHRLAMGSYCVYDNKLLSGMSSQAKISLQSLWVLAEPSHFPSYSSNQALQAWRAKLGSKDS